MGFMLSGNNARFLYLKIGALSGNIGCEAQMASVEKGMEAAINSMICSELVGKITPKE